MPTAEDPCLQIGSAAAARGKKFIPINPAPITPGLNRAKCAQGSPFPGAERSPGPLLERVHVVHAALRLCRAGAALQPHGAAVQQPPRLAQAPGAKVLR